LVGPVGNCGIKDHALDKKASKSLWVVSEKATGVKWDL
jgi:hypothetical protein